jgi:hypothetical protein
MTNIKLRANFALSAANFWFIQKDVSTDAHFKGIKQPVQIARYIAINLQ